jgi:hypothetical protein
MNIFVTNEDPVLSADALDSKRINKMLLESCQMLSTAINECGGKAPYKSTHKNHPSNIWVRQTRSNFDWLFKHASRLSVNYTKETGKSHKCQQILNIIFQENMRLFVPEGPLTPFANCSANQDKGISFKHITDVTEAYKQYLNARWATDTRKPVWTNRPKPTWCTV